jgi:hypothetical protein
MDEKKNYIVKNLLLVVEPLFSEDGKGYVLKKKSRTHSQQTTSRSLMLQMSLILNLLRATHAVDWDLTFGSLKAI